MSSTVPALEIGGTHVTAALVDLVAGAVLEGSLQRAALNPAGNADDILGAVIACGRALAAGTVDRRGPGNRVPGNWGGRNWGVAIPGPFDYDKGVGLFADVGKFESLYGVDVRAVLDRGLPGPPGSIVFLNDADAFLWGEWHFGAAAGHERCVAITLGTGIGSAFVADGELCHSGPGVFPEGRAHLLQISGVPLEDVVSARAVERAYKRLTGVVPDDAEDVARRARAGDEAAVRALRTAFEQLGAALRPWLEEFRPSVLVVGGSMTGSWDLIGPALLRGLQGDGTGPLVGLSASVAARPEHAALLGVAAYAARGGRGGQ